ncbi:energy-coupling factor ABC transporter ATP-binding protein [Roseibium sp.]|uniref:energy-coupling factor ABC transporter ATP-binding protein n=1 Tax=Roseibium sp. TaxID=1936156 RepID=UPI003BB08B5D
MALWPKKKNNNKADPVCNPEATPFAVFDSVGLEIGGKKILEDISLSLEEDRIGVIGLNGSGKSSLVRMLNGLRMPTSGALTLFGAPAREAEPELPRHVGFVFQNPDHQAIFPTVEEEIAFGLTQLGEGKAESRSRARAFLALHGCEALAGKPITELSEGQKQLVCILAVLVMEPRLLVLDEPMTSLDALVTRRIRDKILSLPQKIVMVSHDLDHFSGFDRLVWLEDGRLRMDGAPADILEAYREDIQLRLGGETELAGL